VILRKDPALEGPDAVCLGALDGRFEERGADSLSLIPRAHVKAGFCHSRVATPIGNGAERAPPQNHIRGARYQPGDRKVRAIPPFPCRSLGLESCVSGGNSFQVNGPDLPPIGGSQVVDKEVHIGVW